MAKRKPSRDHYQWIKARIQVDGDWHMEYKLNGSDRAGRQNGDEDVSGWTDRQIRDVVKSLLCVEADDPVEVNVIHG